MTPEDRLRDALTRHTATIVAAPAGWDDVEARAAQTLRTRRLRRLTGLGVLATAAAIAVVVLAVSRDDDRPLVVAGVGKSTTTAVESSTTTIPSASAADPASVGGIYPDGRAVEEHGADAYRDPAAAARAFATDYLDMPTPVLGTFAPSGTSGGHIALRPNSRASARTTLTLAQVGTGGPWTVTSAAADQIEVTTPARGAPIGSPLRVMGRAHAFEGHVAIEVRQDGMRAGSSLGNGFAVGGGDAMRPFDATVSFTAPTRYAGAVLFIEPSAQDGTPIAATVVRIRFGGKGAPTTTTTPWRERLSAESRVGFDGIGPVTILMTEQQAKDAAHIPLRATTFGACRALRPDGEPAGVTLVMSGGDRINVITVGAGTTATEAGVRIGSAQSDVLAAYPGAEVRNPDEPRHWVVVRQGDRAMVFEVEDGKVVAYRTGVREVIEQDEICA